MYFTHYMAAELVVVVKMFAKDLEEMHYSSTSIGDSYSFKIGNTCGC